MNWNVLIIFFGDGGPSSFPHKVPFAKKNYTQSFRCQIESLFYVNVWLIPDKLFVQQSHQFKVLFNKLVIITQSSAE